jgi:streptogramin lyase
MITRRGLGLLAGGLVAARAGRAQAGTEILVRFPNGTFLENLVVEPDGRVIFTNYFARRLEVWSPSAGHAAFAAVSAHPVSLTQLGGGRQALAVHGASFMDGPAAMRGQAAVLLLDSAGAVTRRIALPEAIFPNGGLLLAPDRLLLADSALGRVWLVDLASGAATPWLDHPLLQPNPALPYPGVNGIKRAGDALLLSNSATRQLLRVGLDGGTPTVVAPMTLGVDDFVVAPDGTVYAATHAEGLARLAPGAAAPVAIAAPGVEGSTAVALTPDGRALYALGTGGLASGGRGEAVLARVAIPTA